MDPLVECRHCRRAFTVAARFAGGLVPCPGCGRAAEVPGLRDPLWLLLRLAALGAAAGAGVLVARGLGPWTGLAAGVGLLCGLWLLSRAL